MFYSVKEFTLKDGSKVVLKSPELSDAKMLLDQIIKATGQTDYLLSTPNDFDPNNIEAEEAFISNFNNGNNYLICAYVGGIIIGNCSLKFLTHVKDKHRAKVGIAIIKEYWGLGIGSIMFDEMIAIAKSTPRIEQIELDGGVISRNERAIALYKKKGFVKTGEVPHELKLKNGTYLDGFLMTLFL